MIDLRCGDCLEVMKGIKPGTVDAIITDLPYGTTACTWDSPLPFNELWEMSRTVLKKGGVFITTGSQPFTSALVMSNPKGFKHEWIWDKKRPVGFMSAKYRPMMRHENILVFSDGKVNYQPQMTLRDKVKKSKNYGTGEAYGGNRKKEEKVYVYTHRYPTSIIEISNAKQTGKHHPTQKPVELMNYLIKTYTSTGETVMDICMGSGTTGIACKLTGRNFIGIELDHTYFEIAKKRIQGTQEMML